MVSMPIEFECGDDVAAKVALRRGGIDRRTNPQAAVVVMTQCKMGDDRPRRPMGALGLLKKPFYPADVDALIERYRGLRK